MLKIGEKEKIKGWISSSSLILIYIYTCPLSKCVPNFNLLDCTVPEQSVTKNFNVENWRERWKYRSNFGEIDVAPAKNDKVNKVEKWQKLTAGLNPNHMHIFKPWTKEVQNCIKISKNLYTVRSCAYKVPTVYTLSYNLRSGNDKVHKVEKVTKINARIISKPHAYLETMEKTCAKFQKDQYKIVWRVALTRYPLSITFHRIWGQKMTKWKKCQKLMQRLYPNHMHIVKPWRKHMKILKKIGIKLYEELHSQGTHCLYTFIESEVKKWQSSQSGKSDKN